jgi:hypothetical protein
VGLDYQFSPIDVNITTHPKAFAAGVEAMGLWLWGMTHARQHRTGGRLHRAAVLGAWGGRRNVMLAKRLVEAGLWVQRDDGDWDIWNFERKAEGTSSSKDRMRRLRASKKRDGVTPSDANSDVTCDAQCSMSISTSISSSPDLASPSPEPVTGVRLKPERVLGLDGEGGAAWQAWRAGVSAATGSPVSELGARDKPDLVAFTNAHAGGLRGEALMVWISDTAMAFVRANDPRFGFTTKRCLAWLDAGRKDARTTNGRHVQSAENRAWVMPKDMP